MRFIHLKRTLQTWGPVTQCSVHVPPHILQHINYSYPKARTDCPSDSSTIKPHQDTQRFYFPNETFQTDFTGDYNRMIKYWKSQTHLWADSSVKGFSRDVCVNIALKTSHFNLITLMKHAEKNEFGLCVIPKSKEYRNIMRKLCYSDVNLFLRFNKVNLLHKNAF